MTKERSLVELELRFMGAFAVMANRKSLKITISAKRDFSDYERISREVLDLVSDRIPFILLRDGESLEQILKSGGSIGDTDVIKVVPLILGG